MSDTEEKTKLEKDLDVFEFNEKDEGNLSDQSSTGSPAPPGVNVEETGGKKKPKTKRKRLLKDVNAPKAPLTGYVRFLNETREKCREENPTAAFHEITKMLGQKWSSMSPEEKQVYLEEAEKEREKYTKEKEGYQQSAAYKEFQELKKQRREAAMEDGGKESPRFKPREERPKSTTPKYNGDTKETPTTVQTTDVSASVVAQGPRISADGTQIPIFTEQFLEYSRKREASLRQLRKHNSVLDEQNAILNKQIDHMKTVMDRVKSEIMEQENENSNMQNYLEKIRKVLGETFGELAYPEDIKEHMTSESTNIDKKLAQLADYLTNGKPSEIAEIKKSVKEVIAGLDYPALKK